jgi:hypothetical protein
MHEQSENLSRSKVHKASRAAEQPAHTTAFGTGVTLKTFLLSKTPENKPALCCKDAAAAQCNTSTSLMNAY